MFPQWDTFFIEISIGQNKKVYHYSKFQLQFGTFFCLLRAVSNRENSDSRKITILLLKIWIAKT